MFALDKVGKLRQRQTGFSLSLSPSKTLSQPKRLQQLLSCCCLFCLCCLTNSLQSIKRIRALSRCALAWPLSLSLARCTPCPFTRCQHNFCCATLPATSPSPSPSPLPLFAAWLSDLTSYAIFRSSNWWPALARFLFLSLPLYPSLSHSRSFPLLLTLSLTLSFCLSPYLSLPF